ncbi:MAG: serpin family protein [Bacteroidetes bacterium]|nr:MAG: serpin family protein [Bacteroidota bacterium]
MKNYVLLLIAGLFLFAHCTPENITPDDNPDLITFDCENSDGCELVDANNVFGFNIFKALHEEKPLDNIFISPLSISTALTMTQNGADGDTKTQMQEVLQTSDLDIQAVNEAYQYLLTTLPDLDPSVQLDLANSIWYHYEFPVYPEFLDANETYFNSEVIEADFRDPETVNDINGWVSDNTNGKIPTVLDQIPQAAIMYLINAIYFKGDWQYTFDEDMTYETSFFKHDGSTVPIDMMGWEGATDLPYFENELFQAIDLPYGDGQFSMTLMLPKNEVGIEGVVAQLNKENWDTWMESFVNQEVHYQMPKFKLEYKKELKDILAAMGMEDLFTGRCDLSKLGPGGLIVSKVLHKSFLEINEQGTEAAAVTVVGVETTSVPSIPYMILNRSFMLFIRDNVTNSILFMGQIQDPS